jgi:hypothetical protein
VHACQMCGRLLPEISEASGKTLLHSAADPLLILLLEQCACAFVLTAALARCSATTFVVAAEASSVTNSFTRVPRQAHAP